jgi:hypothetical protein
MGGDVWIHGPASGAARLDRRPSDRRAGRVGRRRRRVRLLGCLSVVRIEAERHPNLIHAAGLDMGSAVGLR